MKITITPWAARLLLGHLLFAVPIAWAETITDSPQPTKERFITPSAVALDARTNSSSIEAQLPPRVVQAYQSTAWFQSLDLKLSHDQNNNGFFSRLTVRFDANTQFNSQPVYAIYSLINAQGLESRIHTSSIFTLYRQSSQDWFTIETDLQQLNRGFYKLKIQLRDANSGFLLAEMSGYDNLTMDRLALEDMQRDNPITVIVKEESGGGIGVMMLLGLSLICFSRWKGRIKQGDNHS